MREHLVKIINGTKHKATAHNYVHEFKAQISIYNVNYNFNYFDEKKLYRPISLLCFFNLNRKRKEGSLGR